MNIRIQRISAKMKLQFRAMLKQLNENQGFSLRDKRYDAIAIRLPSSAYGYYVLPYVAVNIEVLAQSPYVKDDVPEWIIIKYIDGLTGKPRIRNVAGLEAELIWKRKGIEHDEDNQGYTV